MNNSKHSLRPDMTIHKILISTTSRFVGEFVSDNIIISHAGPHFTSSVRMKESPVSRSGFMVVFRTEPIKMQVGAILYDYSHVGGKVCSYLSILFGKRFDCHGLVEGNGFYNTPDLSAYNSITNPKLPFNTHKERDCFHVPLNLIHFSHLEKILTDSNIDRKFQERLNAVCKFYMQALQNAEYEPEIAYLHLITAGEILASFFTYNKEDILDQPMQDILKSIENKLDNGVKISKQISKRLLGIKSSFVKSLCSLLDESFFESKVGVGYFKAEGIEKNIGAAYDLRSNHLHTGVPFGDLIAPGRECTDLQLRRPVVREKEFSKILEKAPTFLGLERVIRYCLLNYMAKKGFPELLNVAESA